MQMLSAPTVSFDSLDHYALATANRLVHASRHCAPQSETGNVLYVALSETSGFRFFAMPRDAWVPRPEEADRFYQVYIDESSQTKHRYLVMGGLCVPLAYSAIFEADIITHRDQTVPLTKPDGSPKLMKWEKAKGHNLAAYKRVVDAYFTFPKRHKLPIAKPLDTHCIAVDTSKKTLKDTGDGDVEIGFSKEFYFLCVPTIGNRFKKARGLFHIYPDRRTTNQSLSTVREIMNAGARKYNNRLDWPYRALKFEDPENKQALQVVDIMIGAIAYRLNGHYEKPDANRAKRELCEHVLRWAKITNPFVDTPWYRPRLTILHRDSLSRVK
jgi:hypothetical protein